MKPQVLYWLAPALIPVPLQELLQRELQVPPTMRGFARVPDASCLGRRGTPERRCRRRQHDRLGSQTQGTLCVKMCIMISTGGGKERQERHVVVIAVNEWAVCLTVYTVYRNGARGTTGHYGALRGTTGHYGALRGTTRHYGALRGTTGHYGALRGTTRPTIIVHIGVTHCCCVGGRQCTGPGR